MERFFHRESVLLGYSPEKSNPNSSSPYRNPHRNSDIDFNDVFGGPPRRSVQEMRHSFGEASDSYGFGGDNGTEASLDPWSGLSEKPVFGEEGVTGRRYPSADFFDDIYRNNSSISSPRKHDKDPFSSTPGSRVLSPARPLPPKAEPFGSFFPAQFSLPAKLPKGIDLPTFGSTHRSLYRNRDAVSNAASNYSYSPLSRFSDQGNQGQEELRNDFQSSYNENVLSQELPLGNNEPSSGTENDGEDTGTNPRRDSVNPKVLKSGSKFHFSIYNWASKGVPLVMPLRGGRGSGSKENAMMERSSSYHGRIENERMADGLPGKSCDVDRSANDRISTNMNPCREPFSKSETLSGCHGAVNDVAIDTISFHRGEEEKSHSLSEIGLCGNSEKEISMVTSEARESELKPLSLLFNDDDEQGIDKVTRKDGRKESKTKVTKKSYVEVDVNKSNKKPDGEKTSLGGGGVHKANFQGSLSSRDLGKSSFNGKVREFVKFLNQEASLQTNVDLDTRSQSFRLNARGTARAENVTGISKTTTDETTLFPSKQEKAPSSAAPIMVDENSRFSDRHHATLKNTNHMSNGASGQKDNPAPSAAPIPDGPKVIPGAIDDSFQIKEITQDGNKVTQTSNNRQELQAIDAKIRKWSSGRERNIRSLLSTLQYVLWPECGWKPLPLVDIIEGTAVKRSYQKALLCLHPDKLQQKGAASHQKYIAEKVFDILQEAWTHFNSLASL